MFTIIRRRLIKIISKVYDPLLETKIGNQKMKLYFSHPLREINKEFPEYNYNLPRIVKYVSETNPNLTIIDIGANLGDTVAFIRNYSNAPVLSIDGDDKYINILRRNVKQYSNVRVCHALVGAENKIDNVRLARERGTAVVVKSEQQTPVRTIENILEEFPEFKNSKVLKVDTDGFDTIILKAASNYLKSVKPVVFLEFDPHLLKQNNEDPFSFYNYLKECGYGYLIFYMSNGDYLLGCSIDQEDILSQLTHYFSGRNILLFTDICAFHKEDKDLFEKCKQREIEHFRKVRKY